MLAVVASFIAPTFTRWNWVHSYEVPPGVHYSNHRCVERADDAWMQDIPRARATKPPDPAAVRIDAPADLGAARGDRLTGVRGRRPWRREDGRWAKCPSERRRRRAWRHDSDRQAGASMRDPSGE